MKDYRKSLPKTIRMAINFIGGFVLTFVMIYGILFIWCFLKAFVTMEPVTSDEFYVLISDGIKEYGKTPRVLTLFGILFGVINAFVDHSKRYKTH